MGQSRARQDSVEQGIIGLNIQGVQDTYLDTDIKLQRFVLQLSQTLAGVLSLVMQGGLQGGFSEVLLLVEAGQAVVGRVEVHQGGSLLLVLLHICLIVT